ncbi:15280_t:CDS:2, partial [Gigaspora rosea]
LTQMRYKPDTSATTASEPPANTSGLGAGRSTRNEDIQKNSFASTIEETTQESGHNDNNQICTIINSVNTTITINSSPTYLPGTETTANLNMQDPTYSPDMEPSSNLNMQDLYLPDLEVPQTTNMHNPQHPDGNTVEGLQDMKNMKLCISTPSTIRSRASTPTPKPTYSQ